LSASFRKIASDSLEPSPSQFKSSERAIFILIRNRVLGPKGQSVQEFSHSYTTSSTPNPFGRCAFIGMKNPTRAFLKMMARTGVSDLSIYMAVIDKVSLIDPRTNMPTIPLPGNLENCTSAYYLGLAAKIVWIGALVYRDFSDHPLEI